MTTDVYELRELLRSAVADASVNYEQVTSEHLDLATPCAGWTLRDLLNHVYSRFDLSARAARLEPVLDFALVEIDHVGSDPVGAFTRLSGEMLAAWDHCANFSSDRATPLGPIPVEALLVANAQDVFIHAWDVATTLEVAPKLSPELVEVFTETHRQSIDEQFRAMFFAPEIQIAEEAPALDRLVAFLGRRP